MEEGGQRSESPRDGEGLNNSQHSRPSAEFLYSPVSFGVFIWEWGFHKVLSPTLSQVKLVSPSQGATTLMKTATILLTLHNSTCGWTVADSTSEFTQAPQENKMSRQSALSFEVTYSETIHSS